MWWFIVIFVTCLFYYSWQRLRYFSSRGVRTLPPFPFLGNLTAVTFGRENFVDAIAAGYNAFKDQRYFGLYQYHVPTLIPRDPELVRRLMVRDFAAFCDRGVHIPPDCDPLFGRNLIMLRVPRATLVPRAPELVRRLVVRDFAAFCDRGVHIPPDCDPLFGLNLIMLRVPRATLVPRAPELVRRLVVRDFAAFCDRGVHIPPDCDPLFGRNLIMLRGSKWRSMRASLSPAFSAARSRSMAPLMAECAAATIDYLRVHVGTGKEIDTDKIVTAYVNDVITSCAFGFAVDSLQDPTNCIFRLGQTAVVQHTTQVMKFFGYENFPRLMKLLGVKIISTSDADKFAQLFKSALKSRREQQSQPRPDFIQTLVDAAQGKLKDKQEDANNNEDSTNWTKKFSDDDLVAQAVLFYVAGFDTTANLINYFLYEMAVNPEVQRKLLAEIDEADKSGDLYEAVQGLQYLDMCVNEVLRLWPLVGSADRRSVAPYNFGPTAPGSKHELTAEAGIHVWLPIYSIHRDEAYWPNPDQCDPERFSPERKSEIVPYTYMPFGNGPRHCIGSRFAVLAAKVYLVRILSGFRVRPGDKTPRSQRLHPIAFILRPADGFHLVVEPRDL